MTLTNEDVGNLIGMSMATIPGSNMCRERIIWHLGGPVCRVRMGIKAHIKAIGYLEAWRLCYALKCGSLEALEKTMWNMIKKRRKDSTWQKCHPGPRDGSSNYIRPAAKKLTKSGKRSKQKSPRSQKPASVS